jgi:hypothetical protein
MFSTGGLYRGLSPCWPRVEVQVEKVVRRKAQHDRGGGSRRQAQYGHQHLLPGCLGKGAFDLLRTVDSYPTREVQMQMKSDTLSSSCYLNLSLSVRVCIALVHESYSSTSMSRPSS